MNRPLCDILDRGFEYVCILRAMLAAKRLPGAAPAKSASLSSPPSLMSASSGVLGQNVGHLMSKFGSFRSECRTLNEQVLGF